jgi:hypothetical protein
MRVNSTNSLRLNGFGLSPLRSLSGVCWIEGRACPRRYLSVLPSQVRANLFGGD